MSIVFYFQKQINIITFVCVRAKIKIQRIMHCNKKFKKNSSVMLRKCYAYLETDIHLQY